MSNGMNILIQCLRAESLVILNDQSNVSAELLRDTKQHI